MTALSEADSSRFVQVQAGELNLRLHYNDLGTATRGTIVMLHGSGPGASSWANFSRNAGPLTDAGYRVILMDCPGWSKSDPVVCTGARSELNAQALAGLVAALGLERVHLIGNSMGAHSAMMYTLLHPSRVGKLVLMGGGTGGASPFMPMPTEGIKLLNALYREPSIENLKRMMAVFVHDPSSLTDDLYQLRLDNMLARREHLANFVKSQELNPKQYPDVSARLGEVTQPVLVIWGRDDRFVPLDAGLRLVAALPNADLHVFGRCGHWAQWEHADRFNRMVIDFLGD